MAFCFGRLQPDHAEDFSFLYSEAALVAVRGILLEGAQADVGEAAGDVAVRRHLARIRAARRARWEADLSDWPTDDVATLAELLARINTIGEAREAREAEAKDERTG